MEKFLSLSEERRRMLCEEGYARLGLIPASIEKDFWVCWTLRTLFKETSWGQYLTFKGGTSLSKGWQLISRFSEDIDVVIDRGFLGYGGDFPSKKGLERLKKECVIRIHQELLPELEARVKSALPAGLDWSLVSDPDDIDQQTLLFTYPAVLGTSLAYVRPVVKIEMGARSETDPVETPTIKPYLADAFPELMPNSSFALRTVAARRTFWEKAMLLHEEMFRPPDKKRKARLSRHYYDLWSLIRKGTADEAVATPELFDQVAHYRQLSFKQNWVDYSTLRKGSLCLIPTSEQMADWRQDYDQMREMFLDDPPEFDEILVTIKQFQDTFNTLACAPGEI